ncbi:MAG: hypothetical protein L0G23_08420, partial [Ruaniaceae bacterium]|nr:hypothetical protein [Ruaniaceae bacterium]
RSNATSALTDLRSLLPSLREAGTPAAAPQNTPGGIGDLQDLFADAVDADSGAQLAVIVAMARLDPA